MSFRVTDNTLSTRLTSQVNVARQRLALAQEQVASSKRINRPSDDPYGTAAVLQLRTSQSEIDQFSQTAKTANTKLDTVDNTLNSYQTLLDRVQTILTQGVSDTSTSPTRQALATELDSISKEILSLVNLKVGTNYIFGGTQQNQPPFDPVTLAANANPGVSQQVQIEPNSTPIDTDVTANNIFIVNNNSIFNTLTTAATALRGTGNATADHNTLLNSINELGGFVLQSGIARTQVGKSMNQIENALDRLGQTTVAVQSNIQDVESVDFAKAATDLVDSQKTLESVLSTASKINSRSLLDFLS